MALSASSSSDAQRLSSSVATRGHPSAKARSPTRVKPGMPWANKASSSGQCLAKHNKDASVSSSHSQTFKESMRGCMTQISWMVEFVTGRRASFR